MHRQVDVEKLFAIKMLFFSFSIGSRLWSDKISDGNDGKCILRTFFYFYLRLIYNSAVNVTFN